MSGRWCGRSGDCLAGDDFESRLRGAMALWERAGTAGEKQAAGEALRRMGVDPDKLKFTQFLKGMIRS